MTTHQPKQPAPDAFLKFYADCRPWPIEQDDLINHEVCAWLRSLQGYRAAEARFRQSPYFRKKTNDQQPGSVAGELLWFAALVSLCFWHYMLEKHNAPWTAGTARKRRSANRKLVRAIDVIRRGYGPHSPDDARMATQVLTQAGNRLTGVDIPEPFKVKAGTHRPAAVLIRELAAVFHSSYSECFPPIVHDLVSILEPEGIDLRSIERHIEKLKPHLTKPTDQ